MRVKNVLAVAYRHRLDTSTVKSIVVQFSLYPVLLLIFTLGRGQAAGAALMATLVPMFVGSSPMLTVHSLVREDKFSGALRALMLASVRPGEYMTGVGLFLFGISALASACMGLFGRLSAPMIPWFILAATAASVLTILLGCAASLCTANQSNAVLFISVFSLANGMIPVLETIYPSVHVITRFWYTQQVKDMILQLCEGRSESLFVGFTILGANFVLVTVALLFAYGKSRLFEV